MSIRKLYLPALLITLSVCVPPICAAEFDLIPSQEFHHSATSRYTSLPAMIHYKMDVQNRNGALSHIESVNSNIIVAFIKEGIEQNPLPLKHVVEEDLLDSGMLRNIAQVIHQAYEYDPVSMVILGGLYFRGVDIDKARPFLLQSALKRSAEAFWLLSSMYRDNYLTSTIPNLDALLLNEAEKLGSTDAKRYKQESGLI